MSIPFIYLSVQGDWDNQGDHVHHGDQKRMKKKKMEKREKKKKEKKKKEKRNPTKRSVSSGLCRCIIMTEDSATLCCRV